VRIVFDSNDVYGYDSFGSPVALNKNTIAFFSERETVTPLCNPSYTNCSVDVVNIYDIQTKDVRLKL